MTDVARSAHARLAAFDSNDKYAPVLRDLRSLCLQLDVGAPHTSRLVRRLDEHLGCPAQ